MKKHSKNELIAECCVCGKHVPFNDGDRDGLLQHSQESHKGERVVRYDILKKESSSKVKKSKRSRSKADSTASKTSRSSRGSKRSPSEESKKKKKGNKSDVEDGESDFRFGHRMVCASCGHVGPPVLKRRGKNKARLGALAGCCPLLAMIAFFCCCTPRIAHLYCSRCKHYLGTYNTRNGVVTTVKEEG